MNIIIQIIEILLLLVCGYLINYVKQKGKNVADKQDIEELTKIVESVKKQNTQEIEMLKTQLEIISGKSLQLFSEEKEAIVLFYTQLNKWVWSISNLSLIEYSINNYENLNPKLI